jgi:hypothetical protein
VSFLFLAFYIPSPESFVPKPVSSSDGIEIICGGCSSAIDPRSEKSLSMSIVFAAGLAGTEIGLAFGEGSQTIVRVPLLGPEK